MRLVGLLPFLSSASQPAPYPGWPVRMSRSHVPVTAAPALGEHTGEVLTGILGLEESEIDGLRSSGAI